MNEHRKFHVPITFLADVDGTEPETFRRLIFHEFAANGAKHLVLHSQMMGSIMAHPDLAEKLTKEILDEGLDWVDSHAMSSRYWDLNCIIPERFGQIVAHRRLELAIAADMGVKTMTIHLGNSFAPEDADESVKMQYDNVCRALGELLPYAEKCGVVVTIENIWTKLNTPEMLWKIKGKFDTPYLGLCYDAGHANYVAKGRDLQIPNDPEVLEKMLPGIVNCHIHDNDGLFDKNFAPGTGNVDWDHVASLLAKAPRLACIQCETLPVLLKESVRDICDGMRKIFGSLD